MDHDQGDIIKSGLRVFNITQVINCLLRDVNETSYKKQRDGEEYFGRPSDYIKQMSMTTEERTEYIIKWSSRLDLPFCTRFEGCNFEVNPTIVIFQQFAAGSTLSVAVSIRNSTQVPRYLRSANEPNPFFLVENCGCHYSMMVAPGLSAVYRVKFMPEVIEDYHYELKFDTDSGEFTVPVIAIGPRGILDFPDKIEVPLTAVKIPSLKTLFVRNVGNAPATFTVYTDNPSFWIEPLKGTIEEEESLQFIVHFLSSKAGEFEANLFLVYDTGEKLRAEVRGSAENYPIRIDRGTVRMEDTFLGLSTSKTITIHNRSNFIVKYKWMLYESAEVDNERRELYKTLYHSVYDYEIPRCVDFEHYNVCTPDIHQLVYQRIYADELESLASQTFNYSHICFSFMPEESEIWPQSSTEVVVLFHALEMGEQCSTAYLEVTGREDRIPLTLYGTGKGPVLQLNLLTINLENIYMCSTHNYEVIAVNKGHIPGTLVYRPKPTDFGGTIDVTPRSRHLHPDEHKSFNLSFSSNHKGDFVERVDFVVKESLEVLSLHIKGCITCPTLHFDKESLDFGTTALGFSTRQDVYLSNLALIPVAFTISVLDDGYQQPLVHEDFARAQTKPSFPSNPREFQIIPDEGVVARNGAQKIKVIYTANIARAGQTTIQVDMWDTDTNPVTLPVKFCGSVASLSIIPPEIFIRFCFVNFPYSRSFKVENQSGLDAYFYLIPQQVSEDSDVVCSLSKHQGYVKPYQSRTIDVSIITRALGNQRVCLNMLTMGEEHPAISSLVITCNGQGAVVSVEPNSLNFGEMKLLEEKTMELLVINDSPIPTQFTAEMSKANSPWTVSPDSGDLEPQGSMPITVKLFLVDAGKYRENLLLSVVNSRRISVELRVVGYGCSVVFEPQIFPTFDWGLLFSHQEIERTINMTNRGTRQYQIIFSIDPEIRFYRGQVTMSEATKFRIEPRMIEISPGATKHVTCKLFWKENESLSEDWYVFAQIQGGGKRERVDKSTFMVTLTEPQILFSRRELTFRVDVCPEGDKLQQIDELLVTNKSKLDLHVQLSVKSPFLLITNAEEHVPKMDVVLIDGATTKIRVFFSLDYRNEDRYSKRYTGVLRLEYQEHPNQDKITCKGFVNFPNIVIEPRDIVIDCELGSSAEEVLTLTNNGPVSVVYKFQWLTDTIEIERDTPAELECGCLAEEEKLEVVTPEIREDSVETEMDEEICMNNDVQDGSGDGPLKTMPAPVNSPVSETHRPKMHTELLETAEMSDHHVSSQKIRELLMPIIGSHFKKEEDVAILETMQPEPPKNYFINEVLQIVPNEETVLPYTVQRVHVGFHGFERLRIKARAVCEIRRGPTEHVSLQARSDAVRYEIDTNIIDFGQQMFLEMNRKHFVLRNLCGIAFEYKIICTDVLIDEAADQFDLQPLTVQPDSGTSEPESIVEFYVDHLPTVLGSIDHQIQLQISHLMPVPIKVRAYSTFPQVYLSIPRGRPPQYHSIELEYFAIRWLTDDYLLNVNERHPSKWDDLTVADLEILHAEGWCIIPSEETYPRVIDICMAVERHVARKFVDANSYILMQRVSTRKLEPIPQLFSFEYIIDMEYVIIECTSHYSTNLINYGPWNVVLKMKLMDKKNFLEKSGIIVQFKKHSKLHVGDFTVLQVTWTPPRDKFTEKSTEVKHTIHVEVANGCTIPITIKGIVTYPNVTVNTKFLDFQDVVVGECLVLCFLITNEGLVDCEWEAKLSSHSRKKPHDENPFHVQYETNCCTPGRSEVVHVYFKPRKTCYIETKLKINVRMSTETQTIALTGRGIEKSLNVIESNIRFVPTIPFTEIQEVIFTVENACNYPVEFFWHHLDDTFQSEEYVSRALLYYYNVKEILLPLKKPGEPIAWQLVQFYNELVNEMGQTLIEEKVDDEDLAGEEGVQFKSQEKRRTGRRAKSTLGRKKLRKRTGRLSRRSMPGKSTARSGRRVKKNDALNDDGSSVDSDRKDCPQFADVDEGITEPVPLPTSDPNEIQQLLYCYIDTLHKAPDFQERMKDPVQELFESIEPKPNALDELQDATIPEKRVCVIFHGAPFTEYQETACRSARTLGVPVLNIDKAITEVIGLGGTTCSIQLRQIINDAYESYIQAYETRLAQQKEKLAKQEALGTESESSKGSPDRKKAKKRSPRAKSPKTGSSKSPKKTPKSDQTEESELKEELLLPLRPDPDPLKEFEKIPASETLEMLDPLSRYEYKIETILLLEKIVDPRSARDSPKDRGDRSPRKSETFLGISGELITAALQERLSAEDFKPGFVAQSLESNFLRNNTLEALLSLLRIVGHVEYLLFVTFLNSLPCYNNKVRQIQRKIAEQAIDPVQKIQEIDQMSLSEYEQLPEEDRKMYLDAVLPIKKEAAEFRRARFLERMMERAKQKGVHVSGSGKVGKKKKTAKRTSRKAKATDKKTAASKPASSKRDTSRGTRSRGSSKRRRENIPKGMRRIMIDMDRYFSDLSLIENVIRNWDPVRKILETSGTTKSKIPRSGRSRDTGPLDTIREVPLNNFHVWYINSKDPWEDSIYDLVVTQMSENQLAKSAIPIEVIPEPDLRPKIYSILRWTEVEKREPKLYGDIYQLVSLVRMSEILSMNESTYVSEFSGNDSRKTNKRSKRRKRKSTGGNDEQRSRSAGRQDPSLYSSTIFSRETSNAGNFESWVEEPLKPRWILLPTDSQRFRIRFQPEETGHYEETYALTIWDGNNTTYEVNIAGVADIPRLDMNPETIFPKTAVAKLTEADSSSYFYDRELYDFGSLLLLRKDKRPHCREAKLNFCNVSKVDAEVQFWLEENIAECFSIKPQDLFIAPGNCATLILSAVANKLGIIAGKLYLCMRNNPKVDVIELQCEGTKLDIELEPKEFTFDRVLLYRVEYRNLTIRNKTPVSFYWNFEPEDEIDPQITFTPSSGVVELRSEQNVEISYHAATVGAVKRTDSVFKAFLDEDRDPVFTDTVSLSGETYDVAVDINNANPIDLKYIKVDFPVRASFTMRNRGPYEVKYVIMMQDKSKLATLNLPSHFKKKLEVRPASGSLPPRREQIVDVTLIPKTEMALKEAPILKCNLVDTLKETILIAEIPLNVSFVAYYTRFRVYPCPVVNFGTLAVCTEKTMYLNIENIGKFPLHYSIRLVYKHPSVIYMSNRPWEGLEAQKKLNEKEATERPSTGKKTKKGRKKSARIEKIESKAEKEETEKLILGPMTITKTEGEVAVGQTDSIGIVCNPQFVGSQDEQIVIVVEDSVPEDREGKIITLSVNSSVPTIDFRDLNMIFQENHVVDQIQDFDCPKDIGPHTVFARQEQCLYFRYISVSTTHVTCFRLYNDGVVAATVDIQFMHEALMPSTARSDTFVIEPLTELIPPMSNKVFTVSFSPHIIETFQGAFEVSVVLPVHLAGDHLYVKLVGESCVPEVRITEPVHGVREWPTLNFPRTLIDEKTIRFFGMQNVGYIKAKVIVEIEEDPNNVFGFCACLDTQPLLQVWEDYCDEPHDRCTVVRLPPGNVGRFRVTFSPTKVGKYYGKIRLHIVDNPYENLVINLEGECYVEMMVLDGLPLDDSKERMSASQETRRSRRTSSKQASLPSATSNSMYPLSLTYILDYDLCFIGKMYKKTFRVVNKSTDRWFRFQWGAHPHVVFEPSIGHIKYLTSKENVVTFLAGEPTTHENTRIECLICEINVDDPTSNVAWDDRQTEVKWEKIHPDLMHEISDVELMKKKIIAPTIEANHEVIPGTGKSIHLLLSATVAYSEYFCPIQEIYFKDTLMFQTREYTFVLSNPGIVNTSYSWKVNMDEQYPKRHIGDCSNANSRPRTADDYSSVQQSRSSRGIFSAKSESRNRNHREDDKSVGDSTNIMSRNCTSFASDSMDMKTASSTRPSDLFSSTAGLSGRTTDSWLEGDDLPFSIHPEIGIIPPGELVESTLTFSPKDVFYYKAYLTCKIDNLNPEQSTLTIPIVARSLLPYCHFDVQESDYVTSGRRDPKLPGPVGYEIDDTSLWQTIRVIEFKVVGVGGTHVKKFHLINPTVDDYHFSWKDRTPRKTDEISNFHCAVSEGVAERGKRTDLAFTFLAEDVGVFESFWLFSIERYNLECLFLVVGVVTEPSVHCLTVHVKLKPTILGFTVKDSIKLLNNEDCHLDFNIVEESLYSEGKYQKLKVTPMNGTLVSKSEQYLWVEYHPTRVGEFHFSIQCAVNLMKSPLTIFVTASVFDIASSVSYCKPNGEFVEASEDKPNVIDLGRMMLDVPVMIKFELTNSGKVAFYYTWDLGMPPEMECKNLYSLTISQKHSHLTVGDRAVCSLTLTAFQKVAIKDHCVLLQISNGPTYRFMLKACSKKPGVEFSFNRYDFGRCYVQECNAVSYCTDLRLTNTENMPFVIECAFEEQPHLSVDLNCISEALAPYSTISMPIVFRPLKETKYRDCLVFTINSTSEKKIMITGEGIGYRIRLVNPHEKSIDLGSVPPSRSVSKKIPVVNEGLAPVEIKFDLMKDLDMYEAYRERVIPCETKPETIVELENASIMETKRSWTIDYRLYTSEPKPSDVLKFKPSGNITLKPNRKVNLLVTFKPQRRMKPFAAKVAAQTGCTILPLFIIRGSCVGPEFRLNRTHIPFGTIVQGCSEETKVMLMNTGDLGSRFKWNTSKLPNDFQITPMSGYCSAGMDIGFVVKFQPAEQRGLIEGEATIEIEKYDSLKVKITGACSKLPQPIETIRFECLVRENQTRSVVVMNDSNLPWKLKPQVTGDYFFVDEILQIPPQECVSCNITYSPLVMNTENTLHTGSLVLKSLDDNLYLLYLLSGRSLPPQVVANIVRQIPAKTKYTELLPVQNWLDTQQRFQCEIELIKEDDDEEIPLHSFVGNERIDVPANSQRDYRAVFYCYKEWNFSFRVTFSTEEKEYQFYDIQYEVTEPEVIETIKFVTTARSRICLTLKLENPLEHQPIAYKLECDHPFIRFDVDETKPIAPLSHLFIPINYNPPLPAEESVLLNAYNDTLGLFPYELRLKATPAPPERVTRVTTMLGSSHVFTLSIENPIGSDATFLIELDCDSFLSLESVEVKGLSKGVIDVVYEPCDVENVTATLIATSDVAGEFVFPLIGSCILPRPMGPYVVTQNSATVIQFKNVFREEKTFDFVVDVPTFFTVTTPTSTLESKEMIDIEVDIREDEMDGEEASEEEKYPVTGKLIVYCTDPVFSHIKWVYYLRGVFDEP